MITYRREFTTKTTLYGFSSFHFYRWNQFKVIPLATCGFRWRGHAAPKMPRPLVAILQCASRFSAPSASRPNLAPLTLPSRSASASGLYTPYSSSTGSVTTGWAKQVSAVADNPSCAERTVL